MSNWHNKTVLVTGGSAGFGLQLATAFGRAGAKLILVARDAARLTAAADQLKTERIDCQTYSADVTNEDSVAALQQFAHDELRRLDVLVNAAGKSDRGRATETTVETFQRLWELNFLSVVRCTNALLPMILSTNGSIVNIGSLASKTSGQFLGAYPATKFPLAVYSQQLRLELSEQGVHVLLVCPGPIRREDAGKRYANAAANLPESAQRPGGSKLQGLDPAELAQCVVKACERRRSELVVPSRARWLFAISQLWPSLGDRLLKKMTS